MIRDVLIVCMGNICRSPMAEYLFKAYVEATQKINIHSAGLQNLKGSSCDPIVLELMRLQGYDLSGHRSRHLNRDLVISSELILTMTRDQQKEIELSYPVVRGRVHRIGKWGEFDVVDPYQRPHVIYEQAYSLIEQGVRDWCQQLWII